MAIFPHFRLQSRFILVCWAIFFTASSCVYRDIQQDGKRERASEQASKRDRGRGSGGRRKDGKGMRAWQKGGRREINGEGREKEAVRIGGRGGGGVVQV